MEISARKIQTGLQRIAHVNNTIAVASGKGGVGKSTTSVNLALALAKQGLRVGLLDADIYGPNQATMLGACVRPQQNERQQLLPVVSHGIPSMSMAYLLGPDTPMIWRGPMVSKALQQLVFDTAWPALDILILDLPPGTGDVQLTLAQKIPLSGVVVVTTPQEVACQDARKAVAMFDKVSIPVLGLIENMKTYRCPGCGAEDHLFGEGGGMAIASTRDIRYFGGIPLNGRIRELADKGIPIVAYEPDSESAQAYTGCALALVEALMACPKDYASPFGPIKVESVSKE